jgi:hypothetical protein
MRYFAPPTPLVFYSDFSSEECARRLGEAMDPERPAFFGFGLSGYRGSKPFLGKVDEKQFRVLQRIYFNRNSFPPVLTGEFQREGAGTRVKGVFDLEVTSKIAICLFSVVGLFVLIPVVMYSYASQPVLLAIFVCGYGSLLVFSPRIARGSGRGQERSIAEFLRTVLQARAGN